MNNPSGFYGLEQFFYLEAYQQAAVCQGCFFWTSRPEVYDSFINHHPGSKLFIAPISIFTLRKGYQFTNPLQKLSNYKDLRGLQRGTYIRHDFSLSNQLTYGK